MLRFVLFDLSLFYDEADRANSQKRVLWMLDALVKCNRLYLERHPDTPLIYHSGIQYKVPSQFDTSDTEVGLVRRFVEKSGTVPSDVRAALDTLESMGGGERFRDIPRIIENGGGDCDNVAAWRVAELNELGIAAQPYITSRQRADGGTTYHVIVLWPDGSAEDPSLLLGMGGEGRAAERAAEVRKLSERSRDFVRALVTPGAQPPETVFGQLPSDFGQGLQYTHAYQTDDSYEDYSPTRPPGFYFDPRYQGGLVQNTPWFNTRIRNYEDRMSRFDGLPMNALRRRRLSR